MSGILGRATLLASTLVCATLWAAGHPEPSPYPISWQLDFEHSHPRRIVVRPKGQRNAQAYWYLIYTVTNQTGQERNFMPRFEMLGDDGRLIRSDDRIPEAVLQAIRIREKKPGLKSVTEIAGTLRVGQDQAQDGVAIWPEPDPEMGHFSIFIGGLSGEAVILTDEKGQPVLLSTPDGQKQHVVLHRTLQLDYHIPGDAVYPGIDQVRAEGQKWVMR